MKPNGPAESTTATPSGRVSRLNPRRVAAVLVSTAVVTVPAGTVLVHHQDVAAALLIVLLPLAPLLLPATAFAILYMASSVIALINTAVTIMRGDKAVGQCIDDLFIRITNAPIAFLTLTPLKARKPQGGVTLTQDTSASPEPLPKATTDALAKTSEALYWMLLQEFADRRGGATQIVTPDEIFAGMIRGRHAKPESAKAEPQAGVGESVLVG